MKFNGIIFDLDGTLVNSIEDLADAMNSVLAGRHFPTHAVEAYKYFVGNGLLNLTSVVLPETARDDQTVKDCYLQMMEAYGKNYLVKTRPYDGIPELLRQLKTLGVKMAVFSNKTDEFTHNIVQALMPGLFDEVVGYTSEALKKPNPAVALQIAERLEVAPSEMIYIGDSGVDMQTAANARMYGVGALWGFRTKEELVSNGAKATAAHPMDVQRFFSLE